MSSPRIGISLSGGGARGVAHIGVLKALLEHDIVPESLAGASAGAIVAALYAAGKTPEEMMDFAAQSSMLKLVRWGLPTGGLTKLTYLKERLAEVISNDDFSALERKLYIAISNLNSGDLEIRSSGPLFDVIMASSSIPLVFKPVDIDGQYYVDGGLLANLPVAPLTAVADCIIGVNVMPRTPAESKTVQGVFGIASRCFDLSIVANTQPSLALCDVVIEPAELAKYNIFQFNHYQKLFERGYEATLAKMPAIQQIIAEAKNRRG